MGPQEIRNLQEAYLDVYVPQENIEEGLRSAVKRLLGGGKKEAESSKPESRGEQLRKKYNVGPEKSDTSAKRQILDRSRAKAEKDEKDYGDKPFQKQVANQSKAAHDRYLKAGYSKYGADDARGRGSKAAKRAASLNREEFEYIVDTLIEEGYDLSNYTWDEMYDVCLDEICQLDELSVGKMLDYVKKGEKNRADLNKKWDQGKASYREKMRVLGREEGESRASDKVEKKTGKRPYEMNALDKARYAVTKEEVDLYDIIPSHTLDEAEGSYGQTPKTQQKMGDLANKRRNTPASEYSERGEKKKKVDTASRHFNRMGNPDAGNKGKKSSRPYYPAGRKGMTQKDRDWSRGADEYGHSGYDGEGGGGSLPKGKKLERQKKTGVSAESFDLYDIILSHLLDEGFASTEQSADKIILNMSESWFEEIVEARRSEKEGKGSPESPLSYPGRSVQKERGEMGGRHWNSGGEGGSKTERGRKKSDKYSQTQRLRGLSNHPEKSGKYSEMQRKKRGGDIGSRFD